MENEKNPTSVEETETKTEETNVEKVETNKEEKTFTQKELDEIVKTRLDKAKKGYPSKEELQAFNTWKESQKTQEEKQAEKEKENQKVLSERNNLQKENLLLKKGVKIDDIDYVMFKVSKQEGEFDKNLESFLTENPKYLSSYKETEKTVDLGGEHKEEKPDSAEHERKLLGL